MSELGDLLELIYGARDRWRTVRLTVRQWHHVERQQQALERLNRGRGGGAVQIMSFGQSSEPEPTEHEQLVRIWLDGDRAREEREGPDAFPALGIRDGDRWWQYTPKYGASSNEIDPDVQSGIGEEASSLLDPAHILGALRLEQIGKAEVAGRPGLLLRGAARGDDFTLHRLGPGADTYELVVDRERGVLLRTAALVDGLELNVSEVLELAFDLEFPPETFVFTLPEGESFGQLFPQSQHLTLEQSTVVAPFLVLSPAEVPADWQLHVLYRAGSDRPPLPPSVNLHYHSRDASQQLSIAQTAADVADQQEWLAWERDGDVLVAGPAVPTGLEPGHARVERRGTRATLSSAELTRERLVALARSLVPAPTEPLSFG